MEIKQVYDFANKAFQQAVGDSVLLNEDLSNVVAMGDAVLNANAMDKYVDALVNHIGRVVVIDRVYQGVLASLQKDGWTFGSVMEKISITMPKAEENESWELTDGAVYEENQFYKPQVSAKFFNKMTTFEIPISITEKQVRQSFTNQMQLGSFIAGIYTALENALTIRIEELSRRAINNMIAETIYADYQGASLGSKSGVRAINLLYEYNQTVPTPLSLNDAKVSEDYWKFAFGRMALMKGRLASMNTLFNIEGKERFTPEDRLHFVMLSDASILPQIYLESSTFHNNLISLKGYEEIPYWQGVGTSYAFDDVSAIKVTSVGGHSVDASGIIACMFDDDCVLITNQNRRVTSKWNAKAEFTNYWYKVDGSYLNDAQEQFIVFFMAE